MTEECEAPSTERSSSSSTSTSTPTSPEESATAEKRCEQCGEPIETSDWYPIATERDADGSLRLYPFCTEACQESWRLERSE